MKSTARPNLRLASYTTLVCVVGLPLLAYLVTRALQVPGPARPMMCLALGIILVAGEMLPIPIARGDDAGDEISISSTIALALVMLAPAGIAVVAQAVALIADECRSRRNWGRLTFNIAQYTIALFSANLVFNAATGEHFDRWYSRLPHDVVFGGLAGAAAFFLVNSALIGVAVALKLRLQLWHHLYDDARTHVLTSGVLLALSPVTVIVVSAHPWSLPLLLLPLAAVHRSARLANVREHEALHDSLTQLANRALFSARLDRAYQQTHPQVAALLIDVDHFKEINDTLGHHAGDELLIEISNRLRNLVREGDLVARLGGDEFAILVGSVRTEADVEPLLARLRPELQGAAVLIHGVHIDTTVSIGVALSSHNSEGAETLLRHADVALYTAKRNRGTVAFYDSDADTYTVERLTLLGELRNAAENGQIYLAYQPKVEVSSGEVIGIEALARWLHPTYGELAPSRFIPLAENTGLIDELTRVLLDQGLAQLATLQGLGFAIGLAVNVSSRLISDPMLVDYVQGALETHRIDAGDLTLEVTESMIMMDLERGLKTLRRLRSLGVRVAIDDFGTGYSSLAYLKQLAVDELKIDRAFIGDIGHDRHDGVIAEMAIQLGHEFGLSVVAEGVEDEVGLAALRTMGCDVVQGFHISEPLRDSALLEWLQARARVLSVEAS